MTERKQDIRGCGLHIDTGNPGATRIYGRIDGQNGRTTPKNKHWTYRQCLDWAARIGDIRVTGLATSSIQVNIVECDSHSNCTGLCC